MPEDDDVENIRLPGAFFEVRQCGVGASEHRLEVHVDDAHGGLVRHVLEPTAFADAGVVPHHVETAADIAGAEISERTLKGRLVRNVDGAGPQPFGTKLYAQGSQPILIAVYRTYSPAVGVEKRCTLAAHSTAGAGDEYRFHAESGIAEPPSACFNQIFDALQRLGHVSDVAALTQPAPNTR